IAFFFAFVFSLSAVAVCCFVPFFFDAPATAELYTLSLHDALPIFGSCSPETCAPMTLPTYGRPPTSCATSHATPARAAWSGCSRSEEHTSELQLPYDLVCRLLLEKKKLRDLEYLHLYTTDDGPQHP